MKKNRITLATALLGVVLLLVVLGWAGGVDYTDQCILHMSYEEYDTIKAKLTQRYGHEPSESDIAHWWAEHHQ